MSRKLFAGVGVAVLFILGSLAGAQPLTLDPAHTSLVFNIKHLQVSTVWGRINAPTGTIAIDDANPSASSVQVDAKVENIDTGVAGRDKHLKGPDFFDGKQFPDLSFKSSSVKKVADDKYEVAGDLTIHGVSRPLTVTLTKIGEGDKGPQMGHRAGYDTSFTIKRSDFGMTGMIPMIGDEVTIYVSLEGHR